MSAPLILAIAGSARRDARTLASLQAAVKILQGAGARAVVWELAARPLPFVDPAYHGHAEAHPDSAVRKCAGIAAAANAFLLASPVYHGSYTGVLKNCLDHLSAHHFHHKPVGLITHGETLTAVAACEHLRGVVRSVYGLAVPEQLVTTPADFDGDPPRLAAPSAVKRLEELCQSLLDQLRGREGSWSPLPQPARKEVT